jgi:uncharacterized protein YqjF (DUF2071 family)
VPSHRSTSHPADPWAAPALTGRPIMSQWWRDLVFLHWRVDAEVVAPLLPAGTRPDLHEGSAWVGLIPFRMVDAGLGRGPGVPWLGGFTELNVRLYSVDDAGRRGVVFRSLEATRLAVVLGARAAFGTPYTWARMDVVRRGDLLTYRSRRRWPGRGAAPVDPGALISVRLGAPRPGREETADFLTARFGLHTRWLGRTLWVPNEHARWPLHDAHVVRLDDGLVAAAGLPGISARPPDSVLWSPGVRTTFGRPVLL